MSDYEKEYYESEQFWEGAAVDDEGNRARIRQTATLIPPSTGSLADIGCGNGAFVNYVSQRSPHLDIVAIDRSREALKYVRTQKGEGDIAAIPLADRSVDCVTCLEVIEHLPVDVFDQALSELARVARKYVIISVPFAEKLERGHTQCPQCTSIFNLDLHLRSFSEPKIIALLEQHGFSCIATAKVGEQWAYRGHDRFVRIFYPGYFRAWRSPICPFCGYRTPVSSAPARSATTENGTPVARRRSLVSYFTALPKLFWPKDLSHYWIIGLYAKQ